MRKPLRIAPSILSADFSRLGEEIKAVEAYADMIHLDVMDGHFVPNITFGSPVIEKLRPWTHLPFDVHLMIIPSDLLLADFAKAGANTLTIHVEAGLHTYHTLQKIKKLGCQAGISLNPGTSVDVLKPFLHLVDLILVMTVNPGFGGQSFLESQLSKIRHVRSLIDEGGFNIDLEVDGGISPTTAPSVVQAGADILVAGSAIFKGDASQYATHIQALRKAAES